MLAVGVDGEHEIVGRQLAVAHAPAEVGEGEVVRLRHALVLVERQQAACRARAATSSISRAGAVGRAVVDDDQLVDEWLQLVEHLRDRRLFVVRGHDRDAPWPRQVARRALTCLVRVASLLLGEGDGGRLRGGGGARSLLRRLVPGTTRGRARPSVNEVVGSQPSSSRALSLDTTRALRSPGRDGPNSTSPLPTRARTVSASSRMLTGTAPFEVEGSLTAASSSAITCACARSST